jgi:hypothetical protein
VIRLQLLGPLFCLLLLLRLAPAVATGRSTRLQGDTMAQPVYTFPTKALTTDERLDAVDERLETLGEGIDRVEALCHDALAAISALSAHFSDAESAR